MDVVEAVKALMGCELVDGATQTHAILEEKDPAAKLKKLTIADLSKGMVLLKVDEGRKIVHGKRKVVDCMSPLFSRDGNHDHNRACDAVLLRTVTQNEVEIYYIDLKSDKPMRYQGQFKSTRCFMYYVQKLLADLLNVQMQIKKERFIILHTDSSGAVPSMGKRSSWHTPDAANSADAPYRKIVADGDQLSWVSMIRAAG
jgi:hypothetical protein